MAGGRVPAVTGRCGGSDQACSNTWPGALAAAPGAWLFLGCGLGPGAGEQIKTAWLPGDGGRSWRKAASPPLGGYL